MADNQRPIPEVIVKNPAIIEQLRDAFGKLYDENSKPIPGKEAELKMFSDKIHSSEIGIPEGLTIKQIGIILESWYETITEAPEFSEPTMTGAPEYAATSNTLTPDELKELMREEEVRKEKLDKSRVEAKEAVGRAKKTQEKLAKEVLQKKIAQPATQEVATEEPAAKQAPKPLAEQLFGRKVVVQEPEAEKERLIREATQKQAIEDAKTKIQAQIKEEQGAQEALEGKKIYAKVEVSKEVPTPDEHTLNFINEAKAHPVAFQKDLAETIKVQIAPALSEKLTEEQINLIAEKTALDTVRAVNDFTTQSSANTQVAILGALAKDTKVLPKIIPNKDVANLLQGSAAESQTFVNSTQASKNILSNINKDLAVAVFGVGPENLKVTFFDQPVEGYTHEVDFGKFYKGHVNLLESQTKVLDNIGSFAGGETKNFLTGQIRNVLDNQMAKLPADNAVAGFYNSKFGQRILNFAGLGKANPLGEGFLQSINQWIPGSTTFLEGFRTFLGVDLAEAAAPEILLTTVETEAVTEAFIGLGGEVATETFIGGGGEIVAGIVAPEAGATFSGIIGGGVETITPLIAGGSEVIGGAVTVGATEATIGGATALGTGVTTTAIGAGAEAGAAAGAVGGPLAIVTALIGAAIGWLASKINLPKLKENIIAISGGMLAAGLLVFPGTILGTTLSVFGGTGVVAGVVSGGLSGLGASLTSAITGMIGFIGSVFGALFASIGMPLIITILAFPVVVALIFLVINSGAYIVPPGSMGELNLPPGSSTIPQGLFGGLLGSQNAYIGVQKTANPAGPFQDSALPVTITYTVTIAAKDGPLTNITITDSCNAINKTGSVGCPSVSLPTAPDSISPTTAYSFTYTATYGAGTYSDSVITNTVTVTATTDGGQQTATGSTSIIIGSPPTACFTFDSSWQTNDPNYPALENQVKGAIAQLSQATVYISTLCAGHTIPLSYTGRQTGYAGEVIGGTIYFHVFGLSLGAHGTLYTLTHETGHLYAAWIPGKFNTFVNDGISKEGFICTYLLDKTLAEDFPEMIALFVSHTSNTNNACLTNYKTQYPNHWQFAHDNIFYSNLDW